MVGGTALKADNAHNPLLRFIALGTIMSVVLIWYMLGFAGRIT